MSVHPPQFYLLNFLADPYHGITKLVQFGEGFAFGRFNHEGTRNRKRHRWGMKPVIHQPLGNVLNLYSELLKIPAIDDEFMGTTIIGASVQDVIMLGQPIL